MNTTGYYGKIPLRGDFVSGRIPTTFKHTWDDWAQQLVIANDELKIETSGPGLWYRLPVYRFYLSSMVAGDNAWVGLVLPSCDSVGRLFPFCFAKDIDANVNAPTAFELHQGYFVALEKLVEQLYADELKFETLNDTLANIDAQHLIEPATGCPVISRQSEEQSLSIRITDPASLSDSNFWKTATTALLSTSCSSHSVWTTSPISNSVEETLICESMPSTACCKSLFQGDFNHQHWTTFVKNGSTEEKREENQFSRNKTPPLTQIPADEDGDTKPIHKLPADQLPRKTDFLELDDSDQTDAPWDS